MKIVVDPNSSGQVADLFIEHRDQRLEWSVRNIAVREPFIFREINDYWEYLDINQQDAIFAVYCDIRRFLSACFEPGARPITAGSLMQQLRPFMAALFELHPQEELDYWIKMKSDLPVPASIARVFDADAGMAGTRERTYLEDDYRQLLPLAVSMRIAIPIWGEFAIITQNEIPAAFRGYMCFHLLDTSNVAHCPAMKRLKTFVEHTIPKERNATAVVISGVSSEDFPEWILANTVVERLSKADLSGSAPNGTLVSYLFNYISTSPSSLENTSGKIFNKHAEASTGDEQNLSRIEGFKIKQEVAQGDVVATTSYLTRAVKEATGQLELHDRSLVRRLSQDPAFLETVVRSIESTHMLMDKNLAQPQVNLAGWVLSPYIPIRAIPYLNRPDIVTMIAFAQSYLWFHGHRELAGIVSGVSRPQAESGEFLADFRTKMDKAHAEEFVQRFPFSHRTSSRAKAAKVSNPGLTTLDNMVKQLSAFTWRLTLPQAWINQLRGGTSVDRRYDTPVDIRVLLSRLVIEIDELHAPPKAVNSPTNPFPSRL